jgi:hypothetical protein
MPFRPGTCWANRYPLEPTMSTPLFTAAILSYNRRDLVRLAVESVLAQEFTDYELLIVDDCSTDGSAELLSEYSDRARVVILEKNLGEMGARNVVLEEARGRYVAFLDSDDLWFSWTLKTFAQVLRERDWPQMVSGLPYHFRDLRELQDIPQGAPQHRAYEHYVCGSMYFGVMNCVFLTEAARKIGGFKDLRVVGPDSDFLFRFPLGGGFAQVLFPYTQARTFEEGIMSNPRMASGGISALVDAELAGEYVGGDRLKADRVRHITVRTRSVSVLCSSKGRQDMAWQLFLRTIPWNLRHARLKYLTVFPLLSLWNTLKSTLRG